MKVILNQDVKHLGEEGDVKDVANGYARNYLFPRGLAVLYTKAAVARFDARRDEIESRKALKRTDAQSIKERLEATELVVVMPAGPNGKLYGAVTNQTVFDELEKHGFDIERKRIEIPGSILKSVGNYVVTIRLYESMQAAVRVKIEAQPSETQKREAERSKRRQERSAAEHAATEQPAVHEEANDDVRTEDSEQVE